jgi:putative membrane protein (TIGR04086 family)
VNIHRQALIQGTLVFIGLYTLQILLIPFLAKFVDGGWKNTGLSGFRQILGVVICLVAGYVAARRAGEQGFLHGFNVGAFGTLLTALGAVVFSFLFGIRAPFLDSLPLWVVIHGFLAGVGGILTVNFLPHDSERPQ